ncbi:MAG: hypothetical protein K8823_266 [Cenarchaeum symbiont of Oopsacas minuta]|nr:hypothetical protein [Cenarchaeum symbiont of Oopsacas minuta]
MSVDIACGKCGKKITTLRMLKPIKDVMTAYGGKCPFAKKLYLHQNFR